jgi:hypothetical protein
MREQLESQLLQAQKARSRRPPRRRRRPRLQQHADRHPGPRRHGSRVHSAFGRGLRRPAGDYRRRTPFGRPDPPTPGLRPPAGDRAPRARSQRDRRPGAQDADAPDRRKCRIVWKPGAGVWPVRWTRPSSIKFLPISPSMPATRSRGVGRIVIETTAAELDDAYCASQADLQPGEYSLLVFSDNGCGMEQGTCCRGSSSPSSRPRSPARAPDWALPPSTVFSSRTAAISPHTASPVREAHSGSIFPVVNRRVPKAAHHPRGHSFRRDETDPACRRRGDPARPRRPATGTARLYRHDGPVSPREAFELAEAHAAKSICSSPMSSCRR